ncbi:uncharacterized protein JCM6883_006470 [Sporobolomyces salmoneus]|uniref:uncharacterized protein n=1 Tax=Sporobolomyces salmoneus TaxID=183962 RepID=UPI00318155E8
MDPNGRPPFPPHPQSYSHPPATHQAPLQHGQAPPFQHQAASYSGHPAPPAAHPHQLNPPLSASQNAGRLSPAFQRGMSPPVMDQMNQGMQSMNLQPPTPGVDSAASSPGPVVAPARGKRSARAYHAEGASPGPGGGPSPMPPPSNDLQQQAPSSYFPQQGQQPQQQQQMDLRAMQQPMNQQFQQQQADPRFQQEQLNASQGPGPSAAQDYPPHPSQAPPASFQPSQQPQPISGIPQPPHTAGQRIPPKQRIRIDPDHIPSPVAVQEADQSLYRVEPYLTCSRMAAPLSNTEFIAIDQGNCNPRFLRMSTYNLPLSDDLAVASQLPLGLVVQPFAQLRPEEGTIPVVDFGETGPPRCERCRGYVNPWCVFVEGGQKFLCNLCGASTEVAPEYFSHLDMSQRRMDLDQRPELRLGSVDFAVNRDYWVQDNPTQPGSLPREPTPLHYIFAIDVSWSSVRCGVVQEAVAGLREIFYGKKSTAEGAVDGDGESRGGLPEGAKVAIITFDKSVQFYNLKAGLEQAQMLVVPDISDMFVPLREGFLVDPIESRPAIESLLDTLPKLVEETSVVEAAIVGPLKAAMLSLKNLGGQLNIFQTSLPTVGPGALKHREDPKLYGTDKEKTLFTIQDPFYRVSAEECVEAGIGINLFLFPSQYIDAATLGVLPGLTGGDLFFHPRFDPVRDGQLLREEIGRVVKRETAYSVTMRIRCSNGLRISDHFGNFFQRNITDLEFGTLDADKAIAARIKHESKLDEKSDAYFQCAALYTSATGQRRVRVHNIAVPVTSLVNNVFRYADMDTTIALIAKESITQTNSKSLRIVREILTESCVKTLLAYRKHCASSTSPAQLILPESFKLFPLYALALMKTKALKGGAVASDVRTWHMRHVKSSGVGATVRMLYPRMLAVHLFPDEVGFPDETGRLVMPQAIRCSYARMEPHGAYLVENGEKAILWLGQAVSPAILQDLYAVENLDELDTRMTTLPDLPTRLSAQMRNILSCFEERTGRSLPVLIARQNIDGTEIEFSNMLIEDSNNEQFSYVDYLCYVHQSIQSSLVGESKKSEFDTSSWTSW